MAFGINKRRKAKKHTPVDKSALAVGFAGVTKAPDYLTWLGNLCCAICYRTPVDVAHLRLRNGPGTGAGVSQKNDRYAMPLCRDCHNEQHMVGERIYWRGRDPHGMCDRLWSAWKERKGVSDE